MHSAEEETICSWKVGPIHPTGSGAAVLSNWLLEKVSADQTHLDSENTEWALTLESLQKKFKD